MDPNVSLAQLRELFTEYRQRSEIPFMEQAAMLQEAEAVFTALDECIVKEGVLPDSWRKPSTDSSTWAFFFGLGPGEKLNQVSSGMSFDDVLAHMNRVSQANPGPYLRSDENTSRSREFHAVGGPNDGMRWLWTKES